MIYIHWNRVITFYASLAIFLGLAWVWAYQDDISERIKLLVRR